VEVVCGALLIAGLLTRLASIPLLSDILVAIGTTKIPMLSKAGFWGTVATAPVSMLRLFLSFLKIGSVVFGSGYVLLAFLRAEFIYRLHWLTEKQLDAVAALNSKYNRRTSRVLRMDTRFPGTRHLLVGGHATRGLVSSAAKLFSTAGS